MDLASGPQRYTLFKAVLFLFFIFLCNAHAELSAQEREQTIQRMLGPLREYVISVDERIAGSYRVSTLESYFPLAEFPDQDLAREQYFARLKAHATKVFLPRGLKLLELVERIWRAAGGQALNDAVTKTTLDQDMEPWEDSTSITAEMKIIRDGSATFSVRPNRAFTDVAIGRGTSSNPHSEGALTPREFYSLFEDALTKMLEQTKNLEDVIPLLNQNVTVLTGKEAFELLERLSLIHI